MKIQQTHKMKGNSLYLLDKNANHDHEDNF